jgi:hypothetical protein
MPEAGLLECLPNGDAYGNTVLVPPKLTAISTYFGAGSSPSNACSCDFNRCCGLSGYFGLRLKMGGLPSLQRIVKEIYFRLTV